MVSVETLFIGLLVSHESILALYSSLLSRSQIFTNSCTQLVKSVWLRETEALKGNGMVSVETLFMGLLVSHESILALYSSLLSRSQIFTNSCTQLVKSVWLRETEALKGNGMVSVETLFMGLLVSHESILALFLFIIFLLLFF